MQVRAAREARGWSQEHLADASGVGLRTIQRVEAGARCSPENKLALCAALGIEVTDLPAGPPVGTGAMPHIAGLRRAIDEAVHDSGERPVWRKSDASDSVVQALGRMGLPGDGEGFAQAVRLVSRKCSWMEFAETLFIPFGFAWVLAMPAMPYLAVALAMDWQANWKPMLAWVVAWLLAGALLLPVMLRMQAANERIAPTGAEGLKAAGVVPSDIAPVEAAITQGYLWVARAVCGRVKVARLKTDVIRDVDVRYVADGLNSAVFEVDANPWMPECGESSIELTRLSDEEARWLERRFTSLRKVLVLRPQAA